jgi:hypothetical protein
VQEAQCIASPRLTSPVQWEAGTTSSVAHITDPCGATHRHGCQATNLLKQVNDRYGTIHDPGQSGLSSGGAAVVVVVVVLVVAGGLGLGRGLDGVTPAAAPLLWWPRVLSQHTEPLWQLDVWAIRTDGRSQNAAMMLMMQKPGQRGNGSCDVVLGRLDRIRHVLIPLSASHNNEVLYPTLLRTCLLHARVNVYST